MSAVAGIGVLACLALFPLTSYAEPCTPDAGSDLDAIRTKLAAEKQTLDRDRADVDRRIRELNAQCADSGDAGCAAQRTTLAAEQNATNSLITCWTTRRDAFRARSTAAPATSVPTAAMPERAAEMIKMLDESAAALDLPKGKADGRDLVEMRCNLFFHALGARLSAHKWESWQSEIAVSKRANEIIDRMRAGGNWKRVDRWEEAQDLANRGAVVVGGFRTASGPGHVAIVSALPPGLDASRFDGDGPFVRDGDEHEPAKGPQKVYPSTWGAVRATKAMPLKSTEWYLWTPSRP